MPTAARMRLALAPLVGPIAVGLASAVLVLPAADAQARSGGSAMSGCGCHGVGEVGLQIDAPPGSIAPGQSITMTLIVSSPGAAEAGVFLQADAGTFSAIGGQGLAVVGDALTHTQPRPMSAGQAQASFEWIAPAGPGAVRMSLWGVAANGNGWSTGDQFDMDVFDFVYGCEGQTFYRDQDGDGWGQTSAPRLSCAGEPPPGYAALADDCDDFQAQTHPDATEYCNTIDDDCDGTIDEDALPIELFPDADGDGYYGLREGQSPSMLGCLPTEGWAGFPGDCRPDDPTKNPGAEEICNGFDDDCDADIDERVRPQCGEGACRREAASCDAASCIPGEPTEELCNFFDDDCDGATDEDAACPPGTQCQAGECRSVDGGGDGTDDGGGTSTDGSPLGDTGDPGLDDATTGGCGCTSTGRGGSTAAAWWLVVLAAWRRRRW